MEFANRTTASKISVDTIVHFPYKRSTIYYVSGFGARGGVLTLLEKLQDHVLSRYF